MTGFDEGLIQEARIDAAQMEWERWRRTTVTQVAGIRQACRDLEHLANRLDIDVGQQRDIARSVETIRACIEEMEGPNWLKSPRAMAELRAQERTT
jgi:hypothetical protein